MDGIEVACRWATQPPPGADELLHHIELDARLLLESIDLVPAELSVVLCDDPFIQALNREHRGKDAPTDVLSFAMQEGAGGLEDDPVLGDLVISVETAQRQACAAGHTLLQEQRVLLVHGLLHLLGYDHETSADGAAEMRVAEHTLLARLGEDGAGLIARVEG